MVTHIICGLLFFYTHTTWCMDSMVESKDQSPIILSHLEQSKLSPDKFLSMCTGIQNRIKEYQEYMDRYPLSGPINDIKYLAQKLPDQPLTTEDEIKNLHIRFLYSFLCDIQDVHYELQEAYDYMLESVGNLKAHHHAQTLKSSTEKSSVPVPMDI